MKYIISIIIFFLTASIALGIELSVSSSLEDSWLTVTANAAIANAEVIKDKLETGQKAEINYHFRLYKEQKGFFSLFGDKLILSRDITYIAYKHLFFNEYVIEGSGNALLYFDNSGVFFAFFFSLKDYKFYKWDRQDTTGYYLLCRVTLIPEKLEPPLHITSLIYRLGLTSDWKKCDLFRKIQQ